MSERLTRSLDDRLHHPIVRAHQKLRHDDTGEIFYLPDGQSIPPGNTLIGNIRQGQIEKINGKDWHHSHYGKSIGVVVPKPGIPTDNGLPGYPTKKGSAT
jgi:hypothetical protein